MAIRTNFKTTAAHRTIPAGVIGLFVLLALSSPLAGQQSDQQRAGRRVLATATLAAKEYGEGVRNGVVVAQEEVLEARLFLGEALKSASELPNDVRGPATTMLDSMRSLVETLSDPSSVFAFSDSLTVFMNASMDGLHETIPSIQPDFETGARVYATACQSCHGATGLGDGPAGLGLDPPPSNLGDRVALVDQSPLDFYRKVLIGVSGTAMPPFEGVLTDDEIWAAAWHASMMRFGDSVVLAGESTLAARCIGCSNGSPLPFPTYLPAYLTDPEHIARFTDEELSTRIVESEALGTQALDSASVVAVLAYLRTLPFAEAYDTGVAGTLANVRAEVIRGLRAAAEGASNDAVAKMIDAYAIFEGVESEVGLRDRGLVADVELAFSDLRSTVSTPSSPEQLAASYQTLDGLLDRSQSVLERQTSTAGLFFQSLLLLVREGVEALLIVGALAALVVRAGAPQTRRAIWWGVVAALGASVVTAVAIETVFRLGVAQQELLEGSTMLIAAGVLLFVSYWLISKVEVNRWKTFLANQGTKALKQGSLFALALASFLAVYREGFETILFYKALIISAEGSSYSAIGAGAALGAVALVIVYWVITRFGVKLPIRPFFAMTSAVLMYMAFSFAGKGIAELQESNLLSTTIIEWAPHVPWMGIYPTIQSIALQAAIVGLVVAGLLWTFLLQPKLFSPSVRAIRR